MDVEIPVGTAFVTNPVLNETEPILLVAHHEDGTWDFVGITDPDVNDASCVHADHLFLRPGMMELLDVPLGYYAERKTVDAPWTRHKM